MISIQEALKNLQDALRLHDASKDKYHPRTFDLLRKPIVEEIERLKDNSRARYRLDALQAELVDLGRAKHEMSREAYLCLEASILAEMVTAEFDLIDNF